MSRLQPILHTSLFFAIIASTSSCGPDVTVTPRGAGGAGSETSSNSASSSSSSSSSGAGGSSVCNVDDVSTWEIETYNAGGDHPRFAVAASGVPWVALANRDGNVVFEKVGIEEAKGIVVYEQFELPESPVFPLAFDANEKYFVLLSTTGNNWNGTLEIWLVDRVSSSVLRQPVGNPDNPNFTMRAALGLLDEGVALGYARLADDAGTIELRNWKLEVIAAQDVMSSDFTGVWRNPSAYDVYMGANSVGRIEFGQIYVEPLGPGPKVMGGLGQYLVDYGSDIRMTWGDSIWAGDWPHSQISPPAVVRTLDFRAAFSLQTELSGVVGYVHQEALEWLRVEPLPDAWGVGVAVMPVVEERRLGLFYVGIEIPKPDQPLRYFGRVCP